MTKTVTVSPAFVVPAGIEVAELRHNVANATKRAYGAYREYAQGLNQVFAFDWFNVAHTSPDPEHKPMLDEKAALYEELKAAGHTNPSVIYKRICQYGRVDRHGADEESEGASEAAKREIGVRMIEELLKLYKASHKEESRTDAVKKATNLIGGALEALGVDLESAA